MIVIHVIIGTIIIIIHVITIIIATVIAIRIAIGMRLHSITNHTLSVGVVIAVIIVILTDWTVISLRHPRWFRGSCVRYISIVTRTRHSVISWIPVVVVVWIIITSVPYSAASAFW
jgi:hypothetical protein